MNTLKSKHVKLIELFMNSERVQSSQSLANYFGVSSKTMRKLLEEIAEVVEKNGAVLEAKPGIGYRLLIQDENEFERFIAKNSIGSAENVLYSESVPLSHRIVRYLLVQNGYSKIDDLSEYLYINRTDAKKIFQEAKKVFQMFDLQITLEGRRGFQLTGSEMNKRYCMAYEYAYYLRESGTSTVDESYANMMRTDTHTYSAIRKCIMELQNTFASYNLSSFALDYLTRLILLCTYRNDQRHMVELSEETILSFSSRNSYYVARQIMNRCADILGRDFTREDVILITIAILSQRSLLDPPRQIVSGNGYLANKDLALDMVQELSILNQFEQVQNDLTLVERLAIELEGLRVRSTYHCYSGQLFYLGYPNCSLMSMRLALQCAYYLQYEKGITVCTDDVYRLAMLIHPLFGRYHFEFRPLHCCVVSRFDKVVGASLAERIYRNYKRFIDHLDILDEYELNEENIGSYDVIFSDINKDQFDFHGCTTSCFIQLDLYFDERVKANIKKTISDAARGSEGMNLTRRPMSIHTNLQVHSEEELFQYVADVLCKDIGHEDNRENVCDDFKTSAQLIPLHAVNSVVYLHTVRNYNESAKIYIFLLQKPVAVKSSGTKVKIAVYLDRGRDKQESKWFENESLPHKMQRIFEDPAMVNLLLMDPSPEAIEKKALEISRDVISAGASFR